jgi:formate-dependent nitrite reductase membrane component NrfD
MTEHFVAPPLWEWYIVWYFFLGGLAGGAYLIGTLLRLVGDPRDEGWRAWRSWWRSRRW